MSDRRVMLVKSAGGALSRWSNLFDRQGLTDSGVVPSPVSLQGCQACSGGR
ncbi:hypothetical protein SAMN05421595_2453 [Austwickia chelonae]|nr:hypothetical protein SAMN05421595_2453 [Austwickia chelonae]